jgi:hypothetical protein
MVGMKKLLLLAATLASASSLVHATTINATSLVGSDTLNGNLAYSWGIPITVPSGQSVVSAEIDFTSISLTVANSTGTGYLYTDLLNSKSTGITAATDNDAPGDYWATQFSGKNITTLGTEFFSKVGATLTWSYILNPTQLAALNSYLTGNNGIFDIGIDPDCHYSVGGISFTYSLSSTNNHTVPDVATTAFLLVLGLAGLEVFRRQFVAAKAKA